MFETPDRHAPSRSPLRQAHCTLRTSHSPGELGPSERYTRQRDRDRDPFSSYNDLSPRTKIKQQVTANGSVISAPHHTPSFVGVPGTGSIGRTRSQPRSLRYASQGSIWAVGGRTIAVPQPLEGVETGNGDMIASGTNASMINAHFLETKAEDSLTKKHEARLALALDIDQARRILPISSPMSPDSLSINSEHGEIYWKNCRWARDDSSPSTLNQEATT